MMSIKPLFTLLFVAFLAINTHAQKTSNQTKSKETQIAEQLADELKRVGVEVNTADFQKITDAMSKGGQGAMSLAIYIVTQIADVSVEKNSSNKRVKLPPQKISNINQALDSAKYLRLELRKYLKPKFDSLRKTN